MFKKFLLLLVFISYQVCYADHCPSIADLKRNHLNGWQAFNFNSGMPLTMRELKDFEKDVKRFSMAAWDKDADNPGLCYYLGDSPDIEYLNAFLAKDTKGHPTDSHWKKEEYFDRCEGDVLDCKFS